MLLGTADSLASVGTILAPPVPRCATSLVALDPERDSGFWLRYRAFHVDSFNSASTSPKKLASPP